MLVSYWLFSAYSLKTEAIDGTVTYKFLDWVSETDKEEGFA